MYIREKGLKMKVFGVLFLLLHMKFVDAACYRTAPKAYSCADICDAKFRVGIRILEVRNIIANLDCVQWISGLKVCFLRGYFLIYNII